LWLLALVVGINIVDAQDGFCMVNGTTTNLASSSVTNTWTLLTNDDFGGSSTLFTDSQGSNFLQWYYMITVP
jgi:hypothetical protein